MISRNFSQFSGLLIYYIKYQKLIQKSESDLHLHTQKISQMRFYIWLLKNQIFAVCYTYQLNVEVQEFYKGCCYNTLTSETQSLKIKVTQIWKLLSKLQFRDQNLTFEHFGANKSLQILIFDNFKGAKPQI